MKAVLINGGARPKGNTDRVLARIAARLDREGIESTRFDLAREDIRICRGCRLCFDKGETFCPLADDALKIFNALKDCDLIVVAGPIYVEDVSGLLKNWIDRMAFNCHRPALYRQKAFIVLQSGSGATNHATQTVSRALLTWGARVVGTQKLVLGAQATAAEFPALYAKALDAGLAKAIDAAKRPASPSVIQLMAFCIQRRYYQTKANRDLADYAYWRDNGWLDSGRAWYCDAKIGAPRLALARLLGTFVAKLMLR
jgi:multimeric flavodoxin WrbA